MSTGPAPVTETPHPTVNDRIPTKPPTGDLFVASRRPSKAVNSATAAPQTPFDAIVIDHAAHGLIYTADTS